MNAEIIAVGSELLTPQRIDTNSLWLTEQLNLLGIEVTAKSVIGDDRERLSAAVRVSLARAEILILTGGLGPTEDDVTRDAVAAALGRKQSFRQDICDVIEQRFRRGQRVMPEINRRQAFVIDGAEVLPNENGTAPGLWIRHNGRTVVLLPGPPGEVKPMFTAQCLPRLEKAVARQVIRTAVYRIALVPESEVDQRIAPVYTKYANPVTTILAAAGDIQVHLRARCVDTVEAERLLAEVGTQIEQILGDRIYSRNGDPLEAVIGARLRERGETLSVAESCTGGMVAQRVTSIAGASDYFLGGFLVYSNRMKTELLGVSPALIDKHGVVSDAVAEAMAAGAAARTQSTWALSVTGVAGPGGGTEAAPVGTVVVGLAGPDGVRTRRLRWLGDRERIRILAAQLALDTLRRGMPASVAGLSHGV
jgi:nicotinamide-nucleotide amidase